MPSNLQPPRFARENLNPHVAPAQDGEAFQQFVAEILSSDYQGLHAYPSGGRDGGIDLVWPAEDSEIFFECKHVSEDGLEAAEARWREVEDRLRRHLVDPARPGQAQYAPWYATDPPVRVYTFCLSSLLQNHGQRKKLRAKIRTFFVGLAGKHPHLRHLADMEVRIKDWEDWRTLLTGRPHLLFRWFMAARPRGFVPIDADLPGSGFREYLTEGRLPYYSRQEHKTRVPPPSGEAIPDEEELLEWIAGPTTTGLVITGGGGLGKTRLMLELGRLAAGRGWTALRLQGRVKEDSLERLAERLTPDTPVLLLVDYIETQPDFGSLIETLDLLVDERRLPIRYVACCRSSYYPIIQPIGRHRRIDLSPQGAPATAWGEGFREATVRHIAAQTGLPAPDRIVALSRATPVLAVFAAWLQAQGKTGDLTELLSEPDFGAWVHKRVRQSFGTETIGRDLAKLVALFPIAHAVIDFIGPEPQALLDRLALDGWVGLQPTEPSGGSWETAHDVLADQVIVSYLATAPASAKTFVQELFNAAAPLGAAGSALTSLQRICGAPQLRDLPWLSLVGSAMERHPGAWREARLLTLRSPLLSLNERILLLKIEAGVWEEIEGDVSFQNALGWLIRKTSEQEYICEEARTVLRDWLRRTVPRVMTSNYVLAKGLLFSPADVREGALRWIHERPAEFQTHYLLTAWLAAKQDIRSVQSLVVKWLDHFPHSPNASFVFRSWLEAKGEYEIVQPFITPWLRIHGEDLEASFVFRSWLEAKGEPEVVRPSIIPWLRIHQESPEASFVFQPWLKAKGELEVVQPFIIQWLRIHQESPEASFAFRTWLEAKGEPEVVQPFIIPWLRIHGGTLDAQFVFKPWLEAKGEPEVVQPFITLWLQTHWESLDASFVVPSWLEAKGEPEIIQPFIAPWLRVHGKRQEASFVLKAWLRANGDFELVRESACQWLSTHREKQEAVFLTKFLAPQKDLPSATVQDILHWCRKFRQDQDSLSRLTYLEDHLLGDEVTEEVVRTVRALTRACLSQTSLSAENSVLLTLLFAILGQSSRLREQTSDLFLSWLRHPSSYCPPRFCKDGSIPELHLSAQRLSTFLYLKDLINSGALSVTRDQKALLRLFAWVKTWVPEKRELVRPFLADLATTTNFAPQRSPVSKLGP